MSKIYSVFFSKDFFLKVLARSKKDVEIAVSKMSDSLIDDFSEDDCWDYSINEFDLKGKEYDCFVQEGEIKTLWHLDLKEAKCLENELESTESKQLELPFK